MIKLLVWIRKKDGMTDDDFRAYWSGPHADLVRRTYTHLTRCVLNPVTRVPRDQTALFDGLTELAWASREDFDADLRSPAALAVADDLSNFAGASGTAFVEERVIVG